MIHHTPQSLKSQLETALFYAEKMGLFVIPCFEIAPGGQCSCGKPKCENAGKHPRVKWREESTNNPEKIRELWGRWPTANIAFDCEKSGLYVIDLDGDQGVNNWLDLQTKNGMIPPTLEAYTGGDGEHIYFRLPGAEWGNTAGKIAECIDTRGAGGYVLAPHSNHKSGREYRWKPYGNPEQVTLQDLPEWVKELVKPSPKIEPVRPVLPATFTPSVSHWLDKYIPQAHHNGQHGNRDNTCFAMCQQMFWDGIPLSEALQAAREFARSVPQPAGDPYTSERAEITCRSAYNSGPRPPAARNGNNHMNSEVLYPPQLDDVEEPPAYDDFLFPEEGTQELQAEGGDVDAILLGEDADHEGHARSVLALYPGKFVYSEHLGWMFYNGRHWQRESAELRAERAITETLKRRRVLAVMAEKEPLVKAARVDRRNVVGTRDQFKSHVVVDVSGFDASPDLLNCSNGVVDLRTGELLQHDPGQKFTYCIPVDYDPGADQTEWLNFLRDAAGAEELVEYIKMAVGYSLTGHTWEEVLFYVYGPTRSGKGTFTETILRMLGNKPLAVETDFQTFTASREGDTQNFDLAPLKPCRFVAASESNKNQPLNPAKVKQVTGGNYVWCAFKHREHFGYRPQFKIWLSSNHPVNVDVDDKAAWARVRVISFPNSHLGREDKALKQRLSSPECLQGVLAWAVEGAQKWYAAGAKGLPLPESVRQITEAQRATQDFIQQFLDERTEADPESWIHSGALHQLYRTWCEANGVTPKLQNQFSQALDTKGYKLTRKRIDGVLKRVISGLKSVTRDAL